jgi:hypothetical protein
MNVPIFDLFRGKYGNADVMWIEAVSGLGEAVDRMLVVAEREPGAYFVLCTRSHAVLASVDTQYGRTEVKFKSA